MPRILFIEPGPRAAGALTSGTGEGTTPFQLDPGTELVHRRIRLPAASVGSVPEALQLDLSVYEAGLHAEAEGFDAVYVHHLGDPGVAALRSVLSVPVLGAGRAAMLHALTLGSRFAILAPDPSTGARLEKVVRDAGLSEVCACVRAIDEENPSEDAALQAAGLCVEESGAEVIVLGSTGMAELAGLLSGRLGVPVVDPGPLGLTLLESFLALGLTHSRRAHPEPMVRKDALIHALVDAVAAQGGRDA
jgi:Asp/Glu/hydantoin racemase